MTQQDFKKIGRLLKKIYLELENEALENNVSIESEEFEKVRDVVREATLKQMGFTLGEYVEAKNQYLEERKSAQLEPVEQLKAELKEEMGEIKIPTSEEIKIIAKSVVPEPKITQQIINKIVKETTVEKPTIIEKKETIIQREEYDPTAIYADIGYLEDKIEKLEIPEPFDPEPLKEELRSEFQKNLKHNIDILGMPDFRKLAMGLRGDIDNLITNGSGSTAPTSGTITKTNGYISSIALGDGVIITITRDGSGYISSITNGTNTWTYTRDSNNYITSWAVA